LIGPALLLAAVWWSWWRSRREELRLLAQLVTVLLGACAVALVLVRGRPVPYLFLWRIVAAATTVVLILTIGIEILARSRLAPAKWAWTGVLVLTVAVSSGTFAGQVASASGPVDPFEPMEASIVAQLNSEGQPNGPALVRTWGFTDDGLAVGLIDQLSREGKPVFVDPSLGFEFGYGRTATPQHVRSILVVMEDSALYTLVSSYPGADVVAVSHPLPTGQQTELINLQRRVDAVLIKDGKPDWRTLVGSPFVAIQLDHLPGISSRELNTLSYLNRAVGAHGCLCSVIEFPPSMWHVGPQPPPV
jgi:hypothetical protein